MNDDPLRIEPAVIAFCALFGAGMAVAADALGPHLSFAVIGVGAACVCGLTALLRRRGEQG